MRLEHLRFALTEEDDDCTPSATSASWRPDRIGGCRALGFHGFGEWQGSPFRWSEAVGIIGVRLRPGRYWGVFRWLSIKPLAEVSWTSLKAPLSS